MADFKAYQIKSVLLTTERVGFDETQFQLRNSVVELNIFESVELPYLTATILLVDDSAFRSTVKINGTERVTIEVAVPDSGKPPLEKKFIVTGVNKEIKTADRTDVLVLTLIEEHAYLSAINRISQTLEGKPREIIRNVLRTFLNKTLNIEDDYIEPVNGKIRYIPPYTTPLDIVDTIRDRMVSEIGSPYFCYSSIRSPYINLTEMASQMNKESWNKENPYVYGQNAHNVVLHPTNDNEDNIVRSMFYIVEYYKAKENDSTLKMAQSGALGSHVEFVDLVNGRTYPSFHNGYVTLSDIMSEQLEEGTIVAPDNSLTFENKVSQKTSVDQFPSRVFTQTVMSNIMDGANGLHDESKDGNLYLLKVKSAAIRSLIFNSTYQVSVPGTPYMLNEEAGVGTNIDINFVKPSYEDAGYDLEKSGKFMIYNVRHMFRDERHTAHMDVVKLTKKVAV